MLFLVFRFQNRIHLLLLFSVSHRFPSLRILTTCSCSEPHNLSLAFFFKVNIISQVSFPKHNYSSCYFLQSPRQIFPEYALLTSLCSVEVRLDNAFVLLDLPFCVEFTGHRCIKVSTVSIVYINVKTF